MDNHFEMELQIMNHPPGRSRRRTCYADFCGALGGFPRVPGVLLHTISARLRRIVVMLCQVWQFLINFAQHSVLQVVFGLLSPVSQFFQVTETQTLFV